MLPVSDIYEDDRARLYEIIQRDDDLSAVLRSHMVIERQLDDIITQGYGDGAEVCLPFLRYHDKVKLVRKLDWATEDTRWIFKGLDELGRIRNSFAHKDGVCLDQKADERFVAVLSQRQRTQLDVVFPGPVRNAKEGLVSRYVFATLFEGLTRLGT